VKPKKAIKKYLDEHNIEYRRDELATDLYRFIKECVADHEEVKLGKKSYQEVTIHLEAMTEEILEQYFKNGNGTREAMAEFLANVIQQKGRLYV